VRFLRANEGTREIPLVVLSTKEEPEIKAEAFALGANDYMVKLPDRLEVLARVRYHSRGYMNLLEKNRAYRELERSQRIMADDLAKAAKYVWSLLPAPLAAPVRTAWRYVPCLQLGGDAFGYHFIDPDSLAIYLLDVCGHGVGAALHSVSAMNMLRMQTLPGVDFHDPSSVLGRLNEIFDMSRHDFMYFTMWYGVYTPSDGTIRCANGGHPSPVIVSGSGTGRRVEEIPCKGPIIGMDEGSVFKTVKVETRPGDRMYVFCDGAYELGKPDGSMWTLDEFVKVLGEPETSSGAELDRVMRKIKAVRGSDQFDDDVTLLEVIF
jgi:sigma-B regulation protein RsbU (phosphoserine phosphatase)